MTSPALADGAPADAGRRREREGSAATVACADAAGGGGRKGRPGPGAGERADRAAGTARTRPPVRVFGVRHHGPGSSRALAAALEEVIARPGPAAVLRACAVVDRVRALAA